jgi:hypothetical protein
MQTKFSAVSTFDEIGNTVVDFNGLANYCTKSDTTNIAVIIKNVICCTVFVLSITRNINEYFCVYEYPYVIGYFALYLCSLLIINTK